MILPSFYVDCTKVWNTDFVELAITPIQQSSAKSASQRNLRSIHRIADCANFLIIQLQHPPAKSAPLPNLRSDFYTNHTIESVVHNNLLLLLYRLDKKLSEQ